MAHETDELRREDMVDTTNGRRSPSDRGLLAAIVDSTEDAVISKSLDGVVLSWNAGAARLFGYTADEMIGQSVDRLVSDRHRHAQRDILLRVLRGERVSSFETQRVARDGTVRDVSLSLSAIRDDAGTIIGASSIARDIGERKALEAFLRDSDRRKDEFLAVLAHELRNPLAPIRNAVAVLRPAVSEDPVLRRTADIIDRQVKQMTRLLDDLLDVSRITHGKLELRREVVTLQTVIESALETTRAMLDASRQPVQLDVPAESLHLMADPVRMAQVFSNLLSNASKYSDPERAIHLSATTLDGEVVVRLTDQGIGIAPQTIPTVFEMFSQVSDARSRAQGGVGIGLALVKGVVELHGGRVSVRSGGIGTGSTFEVRLPLVSVSRNPAPIVPTAVAEIHGDVACAVLVADDNRDGADSLAMVISGLGHRVRTVYDGASAVDAVTDDRPDVVILDLGMPGMDGVEAARRIRALPEGTATFLIALTGWGQERDRRATRQAGFDMHLVKPVDPAALGRVLAGVSPRR